MVTTPIGVASSQRGLDMARLLTLVERGVAVRLGEALKADGAAVEEWRILSLLGDDVGHPMTELAEFAMLPAPTLTKVVDRMVAANLVYRRVDDADRRRVLAFASKYGHEALDRWNAAAESAWDDLVTVVGSEEIALLGALLARVCARLG